eukprot:654114-Rhodomonas_salina.1
MAGCATVWQQHQHDERALAITITTFFVMMLMLINRTRTLHDWDASHRNRNLLNSYRCSFLRDDSLTRCRLVPRNLKPPEAENKTTSVPLLNPTFMLLQSR